MASKNYKRMADSVTEILKSNAGTEMSIQDVIDYARRHQIEPGLLRSEFGETLQGITTGEAKAWHVCRPVRRVSRGLYVYDAGMLGRHRVP